MKGKDVRVVYEKEGRRLGVWVGGEEVVGGPLVNPIVLEEGEEVEWELVGGGGGGGDRGGRRAVRLTLIKAVPREDMVHWWGKVWEEEEEEVDTTKIEGRKMSFQAAWVEAQALFKESVARRAKEGPMIVDVGEEEEEEEEEGGEG